MFPVFLKERAAPKKSTPNPRGFADQITKQTAQISGIQNLFQAYKSPQHCKFRHKTQNCTVGTFNKVQSNDNYCQIFPGRSFQITHSSFKMYQSHTCLAHGCSRVKCFSATSLLSTGRLSRGAPSAVPNPLSAGSSWGRLWAPTACRCRGKPRVFGSPSTWVAAHPAGTSHSAGTEPGTALCNSLTRSEGKRERN